MARERLTAKAVKADAPDSSFLRNDPKFQEFGQSANDYWRKRALNAIKGAYSQVEKELVEHAQEVANQEAAQVGVTAPQYAPAAAAPAAPATPAAEPATAAAPETKVETATEKKEEGTMTASAKVFEPQKTASEPKTAGAPVIPSAIGLNKWREMENGFPQYTKQQKLTMFNVAPTKANQNAAKMVINAIEPVAQHLEEQGQVTMATQLDVICDLLTASFDLTAEEEPKKEEPKKEEPKAAAVEEPKKEEPKEEPKKE